MNANFLIQIVEEKIKRVEAKKKQLPLEKILECLPLLEPPRNFKEAIRKKEKINLIAEIKKASPSQGTIVEHFSVEKIAREYTRNGAKALSVLTEEKYFQGDLFHLLEAHRISPLPLLRKDFIVDEYQIYEARYFISDAVLLIAEVLPFEQLPRFLEVIKELKMSALVEVHTEENLERIITIPGVEIIGVNNRDLQTFKVDFQTCLRLKKKIPLNKITVAESGVSSRENIAQLETAGFDAVLIGQSLLESRNISEKVKELFGK